MRKIIAYLATSADGFIARRDGGIEWLDRPRTAGDYGMARFYQSIDTVLIGRKTYDLAWRLGQTSYEGKTNFVFSHRRRRPRPGVEFVQGPVAAFARRLRRVPGKDVWLVGGAGLIGSFLDAGQLDELIVHVMPTLIGDGIPLLSPRHRTVPLTLRSTRRFGDGVVRLRYAVHRRGRGTARRPRT